MQMTAKQYIRSTLTAAALLVVLFGCRASRARDAEPSLERQHALLPAVRRYQLALGGDLAAGGQGYDPETVAGFGELGVRWQCLPMLGLGGTFAYLALGPPGRDLQASVVGVHASLHPLARLVDSGFDPYLRLGPLYFVDVRGELPHIPTYEVSRLGFEGVLGLNFGWRHLAIGPELRYGRTNQAWFMLGFHVEARL